MTEWELGHRKLPGYVLRMMAYQVRKEKLDGAGGTDDENELVLFESKDGNVRLGYYSLLL